MSTIHWGILGTSHISHVMAKAIAASATSKLYAIGSRNEATAKAFANEHHCDRYYTDYHALLADPTVNAIYIGLPNHLHYEWILHCLRAKKHVLCEKPLVLTAKEASSVREVAEKENVICMEALMYRYHPFTQKLASLTERIGDIQFITATYTADIAKVANPTAGGAIRNLGCYPISLVRYLMKSEPITMKALGRMNAKTKNDNQASVLLQFDNGVQAMVATADDMKMTWQFTVFGTEGQVTSVSNPWLPTLDQNHVQLTLKGEQQSMTVIAEKPLYTYQIDTMNDAMMRNNLVHHDGVSLEDSLGNITVLDQWLQTIRIES